MRVHCTYRFIDRCWGGQEERLFIGLSSMKPDKPIYLDYLNCRRPYRIQGLSMLRDRNALTTVKQHNLSPAHMLDTDKISPIRTYYHA